MQEVMRLLSITHQKAPLYSPASNGRTERANQSIKNILRKMTAEKPKCWDRYLDAVLFACRDMCQDRLGGLSAFDVIYAHEVTGPLKILKQLWTKEIEDPEVKDAYQYTIDLKERLQTTCKWASEQARSAREKYKSIFDSKTKLRKVRGGGQSLNITTW